MSKKETEILNKTAEEVVERPYTLRDLCDEDIYPVIDIIATVFPEDLTPIVMKVASGEMKLAEIGAVAVVQIVRAILKNIGSVKADLYAFLSDVSGIPADDIKKMPFGTTPMMIWDIANDVKNAGFFKVVSKSS